MEDVGKATDDPGKVQAPKASMDVLALNNLVISLRQLMKRVKLFTINDLVKKSRKLQNQKCSEKRKEENNKKAERFILEVGAIKELNGDHAIKFALGNTSTFSEIAGNADFETRAKVRLANHTLLKEKVEKWRKEHEDWQSLTAFLMSKNTGRRIKKKKKNKDAPKKKDITNQTPQKATLSEPHDEGKYPDKSKSSKVCDGKSAREMIKKAKLNTNVKKGLMASVDVSSMQDDTITPQKDVMKLKDKKQKITTKQQKTDDSYSDDEESESETNSTPDNDKNNTKGNAKEEEEIGNDNDSNDSDNIESGSEDESGSDPEKNVCLTSDSDNDVDKSSINELDNKLSSREMHLKQSKPTRKQDGEMAITKICLDSLGDDDDAIPVILRQGLGKATSSTNLDNQEKSKPATKKKKDTFFMTEGDSDGESDDESESKSERMHQNKRNDFDDNENKISKRRMESTFVSSLGKAPSRSNFWDEDNQYDRNEFRNKNKGQGFSARGMGHRRGGEKRSFPEEPRTRKNAQVSYKSQDSEEKWHPSQRGKVQPTEDEHLHPSWEAKKRKKEQEKNIFAFKGQRMTFDD